MRSNNFARYVRKTCANMRNIVSDTFQKCAGLSLAFSCLRVIDTTISYRNACHKALQKHNKTLLKRLPHTSRFVVVELQIFCRGQIGLKFVGPSACRTLADSLSRLTALRLGDGSFKIKMALIPLTWLSWHFLIGWAARERRQIVLVHRTLADKARQDVLRSSTVRFRPTRPDLVADLSEFTAH